MPDQWFEKQSDGQLKELTLLGEADGEGGYIPLQISVVGDPNLPSTPLIPTLSGSMTTQTSATLSWSLLNGNRPPVTSWVIQRSQSVDDGVSFGSYSAISGSPFSAATLTRVDSSLPTGAPNIVFRYRIAGVNGDGQGDWSSVLPLQYGGNPQPVPQPAFGLDTSSVGATSAILVWDFPADASVLKQAVYKNNTLVVDNIDKLAKTYNWPDLVTGVAQSNVNIRRQNAIGWSSPSNYITFTPQVSSGFTFAPLIGCSDSAYDHGGTDDWDAWRVYSYSACVTIANRTGATHPVILGVTDSNIASSRGAIYTNYQDAFDNWSAWLERFYYTEGTAANIASRQNVQLHIANGNEYGDKPTSGTLTGFIQACQGIYDATRLTHNQVTGSGGTGRRYPLASAWLDPTHDQEGRTVGIGSALNVGLDVSLYRATPYLDGIAWSMYPPGRQDTVSSPTLDWPTFDPTIPYNTSLTDQIRNRRGYLARCFQRTAWAQDPATNSYISSFHPLKIATWETGIGDFPLSQSIRPYFAVHGMLGSMGVLAKLFSLEMTEMLWWDSMTDNDPSNPQNKLSDEPTPGAGQISTRTALQNWKSYNHFEGDSHPADWPIDPPNNWPNRNSSWKDEWVSDMNAAWPL